MNRSTKTKYALLGMLSQEPMSGYDIKKALHASTDHFWQESDGQIYPILAQLLKDKMISCPTTRVEDARARKVYRITAAGLKELQAWLMKEPNPSVPRNELLLKLFFGLNVPVEINRKHIIEHQQKLIRHLDTYKNIMKEIAHEKSPHLPYWQITLKFGEHVTHAQLKWCDDALKQLAKISK
jgi:DNA-binding PadR family transcriptional regulator